MGIQFYHYDTYSRIESLSESKKGKSIYTIAGEADRLVGYHDHVNNPLEPIILYGVSFSDVVRIAEEYAEKTLDSQGRKVKKKDSVMIAGVISAPADMSEDVWKVYKQHCVKWLIRRWGENLNSVIEHIDEYFEPDPDKGIESNIIHRHLHFACTAPIGTRFWEIHPGLKAKRKADTAYGMTKKPEGMCDKCFTRFKMEGRKAGDKAFKKAMSEEQNLFYIDNGAPFGLLRFGPKRMRLTREEMVNKFAERRLNQKSMVEMAEREQESLELAEDMEETKIELTRVRGEIQLLEDRGQKMKINAGKDASNILQKAYDEADQVITAAKSTAKDIKDAAEADAQKTKDDAWRVARDIYSGAKKEATSIIDKAMNFIYRFFDKVEKLPGGEAVVYWAKNFLNSLTQQNNQASSNTQVENHKKGRKPGS